MRHRSSSRWRAPALASGLVLALVVLVVDLAPAAGASGGGIRAVRGLTEPWGSTSITTKLTDGTRHSALLAVGPRTPVHDQATLHGAGLGTASGTVAYDLYGDAACMTPPILHQAVAVVAGQVPPSPTFTTATLQDFFWTATYSGDATHSPSASPCGEEVLTVMTAAVTVSPLTQLRSVGQTATLTAKPTRSGMPDAGQVVSFTVVSGPNAGWTGAATADASGAATISYLGTQGAGADVVSASFVDPTGATRQNQASVIWSQTDWTPPTCTTAWFGARPDRISFTVQDTGVGIRSILVAHTLNAAVAVPSFSQGTTSPVVVIATKLSSSKASVRLQVTDLDGNSTTCEALIKR